MNVELTTESTQSHYGIPVARIDGVDHGPLDIVSGTNLTAGDVCIMHGKRGEGLIRFLCQVGNAETLWDLSALTEDHKISREETERLVKEMGYDHRTNTQN
jgi:hypothetical protein